MDILEFETAGQLRTKVISRLQGKVDLERDISTQDASLQASAVLTIQVHVGSLFKVILNTNDWKTQCDLKKTCHSNCQDIRVIKSQWWFDFTTKSKSFDPSTNEESSTPANMMHFWCLPYPCMHTATPFFLLFSWAMFKYLFNITRKAASWQQPKDKKAAEEWENSTIYIFIYFY